MSSFDLLREPLENALSCARRIAEVSIYQLNYDDSWRQEFRFLRDDLPYLIEKVAAAFPGDQHHTNDLKPLLSRLKEDALGMAAWAVRARDELHESFKACTPATAAEASPRYGEARDRIFREAEQRRQDILASCNRAHDTATRIRAATDREATPTPNADDLAAQAPTSTSPPAPAPLPTNPAAEQTTPVTQATALLLAADKDGRPWTVQQLAETVGVHKSTLYRDPRFNALVKALRNKSGAALPHGQKDAEGNLDAWDDDE